MKTDVKTDRGTGRRVNAFYFSGTGTTEAVVCRLAEALGEQFGLGISYFNMTLPENRKEAKVFSPEDLVVMGVPVIAGRVPNLLLPYLNTLEGGGALGVPLVMFGNRNYDDALIELRNIMEERGFHTVAGAAFVGEHSFSTTLGKGRPDTSDFKDLADFALQLAEKLKAAEVDSPVKVPGNEPVGPYYTPRDRQGNHIDIRKVRPKTNEKCNNCGLCAKLCPLGSIDPEDVTSVTGICMKCCACIKKCPVGAKYFDDPGYIYHKEELEAVYGPLRKENQWFL